VLKLVSGLMMLLLGIMLVAAPEALGQVGLSVGLLAGALVVALILVWIDRQRRPAPQPVSAKRKAKAR